jgi:hypothetical protein
MRRLTKKKRIALFTICVIAGCAAAVVCLIITRYDYTLAAGQYEKALGEYRNAGFYYKDGNFIMPAEQDPAHDAWDTLADLFGILSKDQAGVQRRTERVERLQEAGDYVGVLKELEGVKASLAQFTKAADFEKCSAFPYYDVAEDLAKWLGARAEAKAGLKDAKASVQDLRAGWKLAHFAIESPQGPTSLPLIVADSGLRCAKLLQKDPNSLQAIADLLADTPRLDIPADMRLGLGSFVEQMENVNLDSLEGLDTAPLGSTGFLQNMDRKIATWFSPETRRRAYMTRILQFMVEMDRVLRAHAKDPLAIQTGWQQLYKQLSTRYAKSWTFKESFFFALAGNLTWWAERPVIIDTQLVLNGAAVNALLYKRKTGRFPTQIADMPGTWTDLYNEQPLKLKPTPNGLLIYSMGRNRKDENGKGDDVIATLP